MNDILFDNIINARDLGGIAGHGGKRIKPKLLLRTAHLHDASDDDLKRLTEEFHLKRIFDFRSVGESEFAPDRDVDGVTNHQLPTIDMREEQETGRAIPQEAFLDLENHIVNYCFYPEVQQMAANMYPSLIRSEFSQLQYAAFLRLIVETPNGAVLWHCAQGKDRTGWGAAYLLSALGVSQDDIIKDFDKSNDAYRDVVDRINAKVEALGGGDNEKEVIRAFMGVSTNNFRRTLGIIDQEYGGMNEYLKGPLCLTKDDIQLLRKRYLE